jgi:hypothetical protein
MLTATQPNQLLDEANKWVSQLLTYVESITDMKNKFYKWAAGKTDKETLVKIEHYHNQFHIQLINLHDLKHSIKTHLKQINLLPELDHSGPHQHLKEQYDFLIKDLDNLKEEFREFISE